jgi:3-oxoacyl-[acyl-carrier-protein] synthase III
MTAYITATGRFLPGNPVPNDEIEDYIGKAGLASSDLRGMILCERVEDCEHLSPIGMDWLIHG